MTSLSVIFFPVIHARTCESPFEIGDYLEYQVITQTYQDPVPRVVDKMYLEVESISTDILTFLFSSEAEKRHEHQQVQLLTRMNVDGTHCTFYITDIQDYQIIKHGSTDLGCNFAGYKSVFVLGHHVDCVCFTVFSYSIETLEINQINFYFALQNMILVKITETDFQGSLLSSLQITELSSSNLNFQYNDNMTSVFFTNSWEILVSIIVAIMIVLVVIVLITRTFLKKIRIIESQL